MPANKQVLLASRPTGWVTEANFRLIETPLPVPAEGQVLLHNRFLSLDPYMRGRMNLSKSYTKSQEVDAVMVGETVGEVLESRHADFRPGDIACAMLGWQQYAVADAAQLRKVDAQLAPISTALGVLGMPGHTAWHGTLNILQPKSGETLLVSAASGAVGSVVGQLGKLRGCRVVGIAGGAAKCAHVVQELGFDACVDYRAPGLYERLREATPAGVDCYFENVGGELFDLVLRRLNAHSRIALCGMVSQYNASEAYGAKNLTSLLVNRVRLEGFIILDHDAERPRAVQELAAWIAAGKLAYRETIAEGIENAPRAFIGMLRGENLGKQLVRL